MEGNDFLGEDVSSNVQRYEKMVRNKTKDYFDTEAMEGIIDYYIQTVKYKRAIEAVAFGQELYPTHVNFWVKLAEVYVLQNKFELAQAELDRAELYEPFNPDLFLLKGEVCINLGELEDAEVYFERALMHTDERLDMLFEIAYVYDENDLFLLAANYFKKIIEEEPALEQAYFELANCYSMVYQNEEGIKWINKLIDLDPYNLGAWYNLGVIYGKMEQHREAINAFEFCLAIDEEYSIARFNRANALVELDEFEDAIKDYIEVIRIEGGDSISFCNLAGCYERIGELTLARDNYSKAAKINPNLAEAWFGIGITFQKEGQYKDSLVFFKRALLLEPENAEFLLVMAECEYQLNNFLEAESLYKRLLDADPGMMEAYLDYSFLLLKMDRIDDAIQLIETALTFDDECHQYYYRMVVLNYLSGKESAALLYLEKALSLHFHDYFLIFDIAPELSKVTAIMHLINSHRG
ncbi:MAG: tetratricopeptide repeat protein [Bacteroidia bacterium]|nr:tetratricopeptide repeat protein [Bacteroidia bacterium]